MTISFHDVDGPLGSHVEPRSLLDVSRDPAAMAGLRDALDRRVVVHMLLAEPARTEEIEAVVAMLGEPETRGRGPMMVPGSDMLVNFSAKARSDDGRPRTRAFIENLHCDVMANGPAAYGVHYSPVAPPTVPMRFVDMRAAYAALPRELRNKLAPLLQRYGVQLVLAGHDHDYERMIPQNGTAYVVTGGGGIGTRPVGRSSFTAFAEDVIHFVYVEVNVDDLVLHAIDAAGREFDSMIVPRTSS